MPQAKKAKKKVNSSRLSKVANWLTPNTPKKGLLLFVVAFAIAGGGYAVYKSHAQSWTVNASDIVPYDGAYHAGDCSGSKGCVSVVTTPRGTNGIAKIYTHFSFPTNVQLCVVARGQVSSANPERPILMLETSVDNTNYVSSSFLGRWNVPQNKIYSWYCAPASVPAGSHFIYPRASNDPNGGLVRSSSLYITAIVMEW